MACDRLSKITYFVATIEGILIKELTWLFRDNVQKLHGLSESMISNRGPQFAIEMTKKLNRILGIEKKLSMSFHPQTNGQKEQINQELEQYLQFFIDYRQKDWPEWLALAEFSINDKVHSATKVSLFIANYGRELRIGTDIRKKRKIEKVTEFAKRMKRVQEEVGAALKKVQKKIK